MSAIPSHLARVTQQMRSSSLLSQLNRTNEQIFEAQVQLSTGKRVNKPSDSPEVAPSIMAMRALLERIDQEKSNLVRADGFNGSTDQALADISDILIEIENVASSQIGIISSPDIRAQIAQTVTGQIDGVFEIVNRTFDGIYLFGGRGTSQQPFEHAFGGVRYTGPTANLEIDLGEGLGVEINTNGADAVGALSTRVKSPVDLDPFLTAGTRLRDLNGTLDRGIRLSSVEVTVNGNPVAVDLTTADTTDDIVTRINEGIERAGAGAVPPVANAGTLQIPVDVNPPNLPNGHAFELNANADIQIRDFGRGVTAKDLGIDIAATNGNVVRGTDVNPKVTLHTRLDQFPQIVDTDQVTGLPTTDPPTTRNIDFASGMIIRNGTKETNPPIDLSGAQTVQDLINTILSADVGIRVQINEAGNGLDIINEISGVDLSIGENGGTTAHDLGLRSYDYNTQLSDLNHGKGITTTFNESDLRFTTKSGIQFDVNLDSAQNVRQMVDLIHEAANAAGIDAPGSNGGTPPLPKGPIGPEFEFEVTLAAFRNGLVLTDRTVGATATDALKVDLGPTSDTAMDLGIFDLVARDQATGNDVIEGTDVATVRSESIFTHMFDLKAALLDSDDDAITDAAVKLQVDLDRVIAVRSEMGIHGQRVQDIAARTEEREVQAQAFLSDLQDANFSEVISRFTQLQQQLQANLSTGQQVLQLNLLDFLG